MTVAKTCILFPGVTGKYPDRPPTLLHAGRSHQMSWKRGRQESRPKLKSLMMDFNWQNDQGQDVGVSLSIGKVVPAGDDPRLVPLKLVPNPSAFAFDSVPLSGGQLFLGQRSSCLGISCDGQKPDGSGCTGNFRVANQLIYLNNIGSQAPEYRKANKEFVDLVCPKFTFVELKQISH